MKNPFKKDSLIDDESLYLIATAELDDGSKNEALWAKAMALSKGDKEQARYKYIELRVEQLKKNDSNEADQENKASINSSHWTFKGVGAAIIFTYPTMFFLQWLLAVSRDYAPKDALLFTIETSLSGGFSSLLLAGFLISLSYGIFQKRHLMRPKKGYLKKPIVIIAIIAFILEIFYFIFIYTDYASGSLQLLWIMFLTFCMFFLSIAGAFAIIKFIQLLPRLMRLAYLGEKHESDKD